MSVKSFPKIFQLGTKYVEHILDSPVEVTEKIDGSQFNFGKTEGKLWFKSKNKEVFPEEAHMFDTAVKYVQLVADKVPDNTAFHCEYLVRPKHNCIAYNHVPKNNLICFGVSILDETFRLGYKALAASLGLDSVPLLYEGMIKDFAMLEELLQTDSVLGNSKVEGVVIKNYDQTLMVGGGVIPIACAKYVSPEFKEKHDKDWKKEHGNKGKLQMLIDSYRCEARWDKAIQHLDESGGVLQREPKDIGHIIKEVHQDIADEEKEEIKEALWKIFKGDFMKQSTAGFPEYYKEKIAWNSFPIKEEKKDGSDQ